MLRIEIPPREVLIELAMMAAYPPGAEVSVRDAENDPRVMQWIDGLGARRGDACAVAYDGAVVAGAAWTRLFDDREVHGVTGVLAAGLPALLIAVAPTHRAQGLGKRLIESLSNELLSQGLPGLTLCVSRANHPALALYRSTGFTEHSSDDKRILMIKTL